jgi:hypothetical protein
MARTEDGRRYGRREHGRALVQNALTTPLNLGLLVGVLAVGILAGAPISLSLALAAVVYGAASARTLFDEDVAGRVLEERRGKPNAAGRQIVVADLAPEIRTQVEAVRQREARIRSAIEAADVPYEEVGSEVDTFVAEAERSASGAQLLHGALADMPVAGVKSRLAVAEKDQSQAELAEALREQLRVAQRIESQLAEYHAAMERLCVELDTVRAQLLSTSVTTAGVNQRRLALEVRDMREEMSAVAAGVESAYQDVAT